MLADQNVAGEKSSRFVMPQTARQINKGFIPLAALVRF